MYATKRQTDKQTDGQKQRLLPLSYGLGHNKVSKVAGNNPTINGHSSSALHERSLIVISRVFAARCYAEARHIPSCHICLSVYRVRVCCRNEKKTSAYLKSFSPSGSQNILVFPYTKRYGRRGPISLASIAAGPSSVVNISTVECRLKHLPATFVDRGRGTTKRYASVNLVYDRKHRRCSRNCNENLCSPSKKMVKNNVETN